MSARPPTRVRNSNSCPNVWKYPERLLRLGARRGELEQPSGRPRAQGWDVMLREMSIHPAIQPSSHSSRTQPSPSHPFYKHTLSFGAGVWGWPGPGLDTGKQLQIKSLPSRSWYSRQGDGKQTTIQIFNTRTETEKCWVEK